MRSEFIFNAKLLSAVAAVVFIASFASAGCGSSVTGKKCPAGQLLINGQCVDLEGDQDPEPEPDEEPAVEETPVEEAEQADETEQPVEETPEEEIIEETVEEDLAEPEPDLDVEEPQEEIAEEEGSCPTNCISGFVCDGAVLKQCQPADYPLCCDCATAQNCEWGCIDFSFDGHAYCDGPPQPDGDDDAEELETSAEDETSDETQIEQSDETGDITDAEPDVELEPGCTCVEDADCQAGYFCECSCKQGCTRQRDCNTGYYCDLSHGRCIPTGGDEEEQEAEEEDMPLVCTAYDDCPDGMYCDPSNYRCKKDCATTADCPNGFTCDTARGRCINPIDWEETDNVEAEEEGPCVAHSECPIYMYCKFSVGECRIGSRCMSPGDCQNNETCADGTCVLIP